MKHRSRQHRPPLPSILLANVQSLENKLDEFRARLRFHREVRDCHVIAFTETWLEPTVKDSAILPEGFAVFRQDRTPESGKTKGGGVCMFVNKRWCEDAHVTSAGCSSNLEYVMVRCRPFYLPREFAGVFMTVVYIPPHADCTVALSELYDVVDRYESQHPEAAFVVMGVFNRANMKKMLPK